MPSRRLPSRRLTNPDHLSHLLRLGYVWHKHLHLCATIERKPTSANPTDTTTITISPVKRVDYSSYPKHVLEEGHNDEYDDNIFCLTTPEAQLWIGFFHMIEQRDEYSLFGPHYTEHPTVMDKVTAMLADLNRHIPVKIYLSYLLIADEFTCSGEPGSPLASAVDLLLTLANSYIEPTKTLNLRHETVGEHKVDSINIPDGLATVEHGIAGAWQSRGDVAVIRCATDTEATNNELAQATADLLQSAAHKKTMGQDPTGRFVSADAPADRDLHGCFAWEYPVTELEQLADTEEINKAVGRYAWLGSVAIKNAAERTKIELAGMGVDEEDMLRWVTDYVGMREGVWFAAVEATGGPQRGVAGISWSMFEGCGDELLEGTVEMLREAGRLGFEDNIVIGGMSGSGTRVLVSEGNEFVSVPHQEGKIMKGRLPDRAVVR